MGGKRLVALCVAMVVALAASMLCGCGGSSGSQDSKAQFIAQADAICKKTDKEQIPALREALKKVAGGSKAEEEEAVTVAGLRTVREEAEKLGRLEAPSEAEAEVAAFVKELERAVTKAEEAPKQATSAFVEVEKEGADFGFKACAKPL
jgi:Na+-transporting NADH:ubiquinone oxidoreductase subunit NqrF